MENSDFWEIPRSFLFNFYVERSISDKWGILGQIETSEISFKQRITSNEGSFDSNRNHWKGSFGILASRYLKIPNLSDRQYPLKCVNSTWEV